MPNALHRISQVLKLGSKSYKPHGFPDSSTLAQFLSSSKENYLKDIRETPGKGGEWTVVMGNEAGDLDSLASSIAFAWIQSEVHKRPTIPLIRTERDDLSLRAENMYALQIAGLNDPQQQLLFTTDLVDFRPFPSHTFALVDHNCLDSSFSTDNPTVDVIAVIDHHEDENFYADTANPRTIAPAGSCASHIVSLCPAEVPAELATLLLSAILIDTSGLKPGGKALQVDRDAAAFLITRSTFQQSIPLKLFSTLQEDPTAKDDALYEAPAIKDLTNDLLTKKSDVSRLGAWDLLRRDYKEYSYVLPWATNQPSIKAGLSTVPVRLDAWATQGRLEKDAIAWMESRQLTILGVLTSFRDGNRLGKSGNGKHKREMAWIIRGETAQVSPEAPAGAARGELDYAELASRLWKGLEDSEEIKVKRYKKKFDLEKGGKLPPKTRARVYKQGNADATRKATAPLLKSILESSAPLPSSPNSPKL